VMDLIENSLEENLFGKGVSRPNIISKKSKNVTGKNAPILSNIEPPSVEKDSQSRIQKLRAVWYDEEDDNIVIDLESTHRLKKLKKGDDKISGSQLTDVLKERFSTRQLDWAIPQQQLVSENSLLGKSEPLVSSKKPRFINNTPVASENINLRRLVNANINEPSKQSINAMSFHSSGNVLLAAGQDKHVRFFKVDGEKNEKLLTVHVPDMAIRSASFLRASSSCLLAGRSPYLLSYDTTAGSMHRIPGPVGWDVKSLEHMSVSPGSEHAAFLGASGYVHVLAPRSQQWITNVKMNTAARASSFIGEYWLLTSGVDAEVYLWDLRKTGKCVARFAHDDGSCTSSLSGFYSSSGESYVAVGAESGVVSVFAANALLNAVDSATKQPYKQVKSMMNLTTKITSSAFHPSGQLLAYASNQRKDLLKLVHLPSRAVLSQWPTSRTPLGKVETMAFSPGGGYLAIGNAGGHVLLYQIDNFGAA